MSDARHTIDTRLISSRRLRVELGIDGVALRRLRKRGLFPNPLPGTRLYVRAEVDAALDRKGEREAKISSGEQRLIERARQWGKSP